MRVTGGGGDEIISEGVKSSEITGGSFQPSHQATSGVTGEGGEVISTQGVAVEIGVDITSAPPRSTM
jgi:hypothetical protein